MRPDLVRSALTHDTPPRALQRLPDFAVLLCHLPPTELRGRAATGIDPERLRDEAGVLGAWRVMQLPHRRLDVGVTHPLLHLGTYLGHGYFPIASSKAPISQDYSSLRTRPERFELPTFGSVDRRSIQLSYGRVATQSSPRASQLGTQLRRGRDSNPRTRSTPVTRFPVAPVQPLRHLSGDRSPSSTTATPPSPITTDGRQAAGCLRSKAATPRTEGYDTSAIYAGRLNRCFSRPPKRSARTSV
jgi:hypothetical protein